MKKEVSLFLVILLLVVPFSSAQFNSIEIKNVNVNDNSIQVLVQNNFNQDFNKITFIINEQYQIIKEEEVNAFETRYFVVSYPYGVNLVSLQVIVNDQTASYLFTGNEDMFVINQEITSQIVTTESNSPISYIYSGERIAKIQDGNVVYFSSDNIGSTSLETDNLGSISFKANYLPFGKELSFSSINKEKYGFTGKEFDGESSLNYFNARYYNPSNGKFISNDPIFKPTEGGYQYVNNNPLTITDPSGMQFTEARSENNFAPEGSKDNPYILFSINVYSAGGKQVSEGEYWNYAFEQANEKELQRIRENPASIGLISLGIEIRGVEFPFELASKMIRLQEKMMARGISENAAERLSVKWGKRQLSLFKPVKGTIKAVGNEKFAALGTEKQRALLNLLEEARNVKTARSLRRYLDNLVKEGFLTRKEQDAHFVYDMAGNGGRIKSKYPLPKIPKDLRHASDVSWDGRTLNNRNWAMGKIREYFGLER